MFRLQSLFTFFLQSGDDIRRYTIKLFSEIKDKVIPLKINK